MQRLDNIDRIPGQPPRASAARRVRYVGYSRLSTWHVWQDRTSKFWWASARGDVARLLRAATLTALSHKLKQEA